MTVDASITTPSRNNWCRYHNTKQWLLVQKFQSEAVTVGAAIPTRSVLLPKGTYSVLHYTHSKIFSESMRHSYASRQPIRTFQINHSANSQNDAWTKTKKVYKIRKRSGIIYTEHWSCVFYDLQRGKVCSWRWRERSIQLVWKARI